MLALPVAFRVAPGSRSIGLPVRDTVPQCFRGARSDVKTHREECPRPTLTGTTGAVALTAPGRILAVKASLNTCGL